MHERVGEIYRKITIIYVCILLETTDNYTIRFIFHSTHLKICDYHLRFLILTCYVRCTIKKEDWGDGKCSKREANMKHKGGSKRKMGM